MIAAFFRKLKLAFEDKFLRGKILFVLAAILVFRVLSAIPIPGIDAEKLQQFFGDNQFLGLLNIFSGGGLSGLSLVMLGVGPYITASIIMQLITVVSPKVKEMYQEQGESGRKKFSMISRYLTVPIAVVQGFGLLLLLKQQGILPDLSNFDFAVAIIVVVAGSMLLTWIGELISEFGIGNGVSIIIFAGIVAAIPNAIFQFAAGFDATQIPTLIAFIVVAIVIILGSVIISEAERPIPVTYSKHQRGGGTAGGTQTYLPLKVNQSGVMPIIFALSILLLPQMIINIMGGATSSAAIAVVNGLTAFMNNIWAYGITYFVFVVVFTYFYTAVTFDPESISKNLQRNGAFVPGIRPGEATAKYIGDVLTRITLVGAMFLGFIAVLPIIVQGATGINSLTIGGTALLIAVSVVIDLIKKIEAQISMKEY